MSSTHPPTKTGTDSKDTFQTYLASLTVCCTGIAKDGRDLAMRLSTELGFTFTRNFMSTTSILVTDATTTEKYKAAVRYRLTIVEPAWLSRLEAIANMGTLDMTSFKSLTKKSLFPPLRGLTICVTGHTLDEREEVEAMVNQMGGTFLPDLTLRCTHLITEKVTGPKCDLATRSSGRIVMVKLRWLHSCKKYRACVDTTPFLFPIDRSVTPLSDPSSVVKVTQLASGGAGPMELRKRKVPPAQLEAPIRGRASAMVTSTIRSTYTSAPTSSIPALGNGASLISDATPRANRVTGYGSAGTAFPSTSLSTTATATAASLNPTPSIPEAGRTSPTKFMKGVHVQFSATIPRVTVKHLRNILHAAGGTYIPEALPRGSLPPGSITHLLFREGEEHGDSASRIVPPSGVNGTRWVTAAWVDECSRQRALVPCAPYLLDAPASAKAEERCNESRPPTQRSVPPAAKSTPIPTATPRTTRRYDAIEAVLRGNSLDPSAVPDCMSGIRRSHSRPTIPAASTSSITRSDNQDAIPPSMMGDLEEASDEDEGYPPSDALHGATIHLVGFGSEKSEKMRIAIEVAGGICDIYDPSRPAHSNNYSNMGTLRLVGGPARSGRHITLVPFLGDPAALHLPIGHSTLTTEHWLERTLEDGLYAPYNSSILYSPFLKLRDRPELRTLRICISGYDHTDRYHLTILASAIGAKIVDVFTKRISVLICKAPEGKKYEMARLWRCPTVTRAWLEALAAHPGHRIVFEDYLCGSKEEPLTSSSLRPSSSVANIHRDDPSKPLISTMSNPTTTTSANPFVPSVSISVISSVPTTATIPSSVLPKVESAVKAETFIRPPTRTKSVNPFTAKILAAHAVQVAEKAARQEEEARAAAIAHNHYATCTTASTDELTARGRITAEPIIIPPAQPTRQIAWDPRGNL